MALSHAIYLSNDALRLPDKETKSDEIKRDYKSLYDDSAHFTTYFKEPSNSQSRASEPQENKLSREHFQNQFKILLKKFKKWGEDNKCHFQEHIDGFEGRIFNAEWAGMHDNEWFEKYKKNLETIWFYAQNPDLTEIEKNAINFQLGDAFDATTCSPGSGNNVATLVDQLNNQVSLPRWLSRMCNEMVDSHAALHISTKNIARGYKNHVYGAFRTYARNDGWPCSFDTTGTNDPYGSHTQIEPNDITSLTLKLKNTFTPTGIVNRIVNDFKLQLENISHVKAGNWFTSEKNIIARIEDVLNKIELGIVLDDIFDIAQDGFLRFNEFKFRQHVLKALKDQKKLFKSSGWVQRALLPTDLMCWYFNEGAEQPELVFIEDQKGNLETSISSVVKAFKAVTPLQNSLNKIMYQCADNELEKAFRDKNFKSVVRLVRIGYSLSRKDQHGNSIVKNLAHHGAWEDVDDALTIYHERKDNYDIQIDHVFLYALKDQHLKRVGQLLNQFKIDFTYYMTSNGYYPLHYAIQQNNIPLAMTLVHRGASVNQHEKTTHRVTPLMVAVLPEVKIETFNWLLTQDVALDLPNSQGLTALALAAEYGQTEKVHTLILRLRKNKKLDSNLLNIALYRSVIEGHQQTAETLILAGGSIDSLQQHGVLNQLANANKWEMFNFLIQQGYNLTAKNKAGFTPIVTASLNKQWETVKNILKEKIVNPNEAMLGVALLLACQDAEWDLVDLLFNYNIHPNTCYNYGKTSLHFAILHNQVKDEEQKGKCSLAKRLLQTGWDINITVKEYGFAPIHLAAGDEKVELKTLSWLLEQKGIDYKKEDKDGNTPLMLAVKSSSFEKISELLKYNVNLELPRDNKKSVLDLARETKNQNIIDLLSSNPIKLRLAKQKIDRADYAGAAIVLLEIFANDQLYFFQEWEKIKPGLMVASVDDTNSFAKLNECCFEHAAEAKDSVALKAFFDENPTQTMLNKVLANALKANHVGMADMLLQHYQHVDPNGRPIAELHPLRIVCKKEVSLETFNWLLTHPKLQPELITNSVYFISVVCGLAKVNDTEKLNHLLKIEKVQIFLARDSSLDYTNEASRLVEEVMARNFKIKNILNQLQANKLADKIDTSVLKAEVLPIFINEMNAEDRPRINFILNLFNNNREEKIDHTMPPNLDWYSQAFVLAHNCNDEKEYEARQKTIRIRAVAHLETFLRPLPAEKRKEWVEKAKREFVFNKHTRRHFEFWGSPDTLGSLDKLLLPVKPNVPAGNVR